MTVAAAQRGPLITSAAAGALWGPHLVRMDERVTRWGAVTLATLTELASDPSTGVRLASGVVVSADDQIEPFDWVAALDSARPCDPAELPAGYAAGWRLTGPIVSMPDYLGYLMARLDRGGAAPGGRVRLAGRGGRADHGASDRELFRYRGEAPRSGS